MTYPNKIAIIILESLLPWQKLNVASFLASSVAIENPEIHGRQFINADSIVHNAFIKNPILIYSASSQSDLQKVYLKAAERELQIGIYLEELFATKGEEENIEIISKSSVDNQKLVGIVIFGENKKVDKAIKGLRFHQ